jgi:hypothetical protein
MSATAYDQTRQNDQTHTGRTIEELEELKRKVVAAYYESPGDATFKAAWEATKALDAARQRAKR